MGSFIARQPNGLLCRFSTIVDCITDYNMTDEEYIELRAEMAREDARFDLGHNVRPFDWVKEQTEFSNITKEKWAKILKEMGEE